MQPGYRMRSEPQTKRKPWWETSRLDVSRRGGTHVAIDELLDNKLTPRFRLGEDGCGQRLVFVRIVSARSGSSLFPVGKGYSARDALTDAITKMKADLSG